VRFLFPTLTLNNNNNNNNSNSNNNAVIVVNYFTPTSGLFFRMDLPFLSCLGCGDEML
jgi:hypothetical protein